MVQSIIKSIIYVPTVILDAFTSPINWLVNKVSGYELPTFTGAIIGTNWKNPELRNYYAYSVKIGHSLRTSHVTVILSINKDKDLTLRINDTFIDLGDIDFSYPKT